MRRMATVEGGRLWALLTLWPSGLQVSGVSSESCRLPRPEVRPRAGTPSNPQPSHCGHLLHADSPAASSTTLVPLLSPLRLAAATRGCVPVSSCSEEADLTVSVLQRRTSEKDKRFCCGERVSLPEGGDGHKHAAAGLVPATGGGADIDWRVSISCCLVNSERNLLF